MQSASRVLRDLGHRNNADDHALPTREEIKDSIAKNKPLLACVGAPAPANGLDLDFIGGHWVVIVGISEDGSKITVFDPEDGILHKVDYSDKTYRDGMFWQNTSYVDPS